MFSCFRDDVKVAPNFSGVFVSHLSSVTFFNKLSIWKKFKCKVERLILRQRRSRWDGSLWAVSSGSMLFAKAYYLRLWQWELNKIKILKISHRDLSRKFDTTYDVDIFKHQFRVLQTYKWRYQGNVAITKHSLPGASKEVEMRKK